MTVDRERTDKSGVLRSFHFDSQGVGIFDVSHVKTEAICKLYLMIYP